MPANLRANRWKAANSGRVRAYSAWRSMRQRCQNAAHPDFRNYGARGITVCERWQSFENFMADMGFPPPNLTLERRDNDDGYSPNNCCWATRKEQRLNQRPMSAVELEQRRSKALEQKFWLYRNR